MYALKTRAFALILGTTALTTAVACSSEPGRSSDSSKVHSEKIRTVFSDPTRFFSVFPLGESPDDAKLMPTLADTGIPTSDLAIWNTHARGVKGLPDGKADETLEVPRSGDKSISKKDCLSNVANWKVSQLRFAPFESVLPGQPSVYEAYAKTRGQIANRLVEVRLSLHPVCAEAGDSFTSFEDQAFHVVVAPMPSAAFRANFYGHLAKYKTLALAGDVGAQKELDAVLDAINSPEYDAFRERVIDDYAVLAEKKAKSTSTDETRMLNHITHFLSKLVSVFDDARTPVSTSRAIKAVMFDGDTSLRDDPEAKKIALSLLKRYFVAPDIVRVAAMMTVGEQDAAEFGWYFSLLGAGPNSGLKLTKAQSKIYADRYHPARLETYVAEAAGPSVRIYRATDAGWYSESRGLVSGSEITIPKSKVSLLSQVDFDSPLVPNADDGHEGNAIWPTGDALENLLQRATDPAHANATTTTCATCHNAQNVGRDVKGALALTGSREGAYNFHMLRAGMMSLRTARETAEESAKLGK